MNTENFNVLTLDVGGTNLVFGRVENGVIRKEQLTLPAQAETLEDFIKKLFFGFETVASKSQHPVDAISFSFPGPADYTSGIIGDLENLPFFRGGVPLKKILENRFKLPVFINNDGDLFALGEALHGFLPEINMDAPVVYKNLLGVTLGTGFGGGIVSGGTLFPGDNSATGEINRMSSFADKTKSVEETLSKRGIRFLYAQNAGIEPEQSPEPADIYKIAAGEQEGNKEAARNAWKTFGEVLGDALANAVTLLDCCVVIGGGISGAWPLFLQHAVNHMNGLLKKNDGGSVQRMEVFAYNWENDDCRNDFLKNEARTLPVLYSDETVVYRETKKIAVGISKLGTAGAVALGAYDFAKENMMNAPV